MFLRFFHAKIPQAIWTYGIFCLVGTGRPPCLPPFGRLRLGGLIFFGFAGQGRGTLSHTLQTFTPLRGQRGR